MSVGSLLHEEDCARGSQEYDQCGYRVGDTGPRYPALKPASGAKYAGIAYPAAIIVPGIASRNCFQESPPPGFAHPVPDPGEPSGFPLSFGRRCSMRSGIFPCSNPVTVGCPASFPRCRLCLLLRRGFPRVRRALLPPWRRSAQVGMVSLTMVPCRCSVSRSSGLAAPYMVRRPEPDWIHSFRPGFLISVTVIHRPIPLVGIPVPETSSWTASLWRRRRFPVVAFPSCLPGWPGCRGPSQL